MLSPRSSIVAAVLGVAVAVGVATPSFAMPRCFAHEGHTLYRDGFARVYETPKGARWACVLTRRTRMRISRQPGVFASAGGFLVGSRFYEDTEHSAYQYGRIWRYDLIERRRAPAIAVGSDSDPYFFTRPLITGTGTIAWMESAVTTQETQGSDVRIARFGEPPETLDRGTDVNYGSLALASSPLAPRVGVTTLYWQRAGVPQTRPIE